MSFAKIIMFIVAACFLAACGSTGRDTSPNYHINSMERLDKSVHCPVQHHAKSAVPKDWNKDK